MAGRTARRRVLRVTLPQDGTADGPADGPAVAVRADARADLLAAEEPLGIRVDGTALTMTMRTPGGRRSSSRRDSWSARRWSGPARRSPRSSSATA